jgi:hypothetical protein
MTAFDPSTQFPAGITTVEQGAHFFLALLYDLHKTDKYQEMSSSELTPYLLLNKDSRRMIPRESSIEFPSKCTLNIELPLTKFG